MACCELCEEFEMEAKDEFYEVFFRWYKEALQEYFRLKSLFKDVAWYNFETKARSWTGPWPPTVQQSFVKLEGASYKRYRTRRGEREAAMFPVYYEGAVEYAPELPPKIVLAEVEKAADLCKMLEKQCYAPYDWAPGGDEYNYMLRTSPTVALFSRNHLNDTYLHDTHISKS